MQIRCVRREGVYQTSSLPWSVKLIFTESQNHRMAVVGKNIWRSLGPTLMLKRDHLEPDAEDCF